MEKADLSLAIITFNEEENIGRTLESICQIAKEIIIVDSFSSDKTVKIARTYNAKVFLEKWKGHIEQKNSALEKCNAKWVLSLDADEVLSDELKKNILKAIKEENSDGFFLNRKTHYLGKLMNFAWQPDKKLRLVKRSCNPNWQGLNPHDYLTIQGKTASLKGDLTHYSYKDLRHHLQKTIDYAKISAKVYFENNKKASLIKLTLNPLFAFFKIYFIQLGVLDGFRGLLAAFSSMLGTFLKYSFLWELEHFSNKKQ